MIEHRPNWSSSSGGRVWKEQLDVSGKKGADCTHEPDRNCRLLVTQRSTADGLFPGRQPERTSKSTLTKPFEGDHAEHAVIVNPHRENRTVVGKHPAETNSASANPDSRAAPHLRGSAGDDWPGRWNLPDASVPKGSVPATMTRSASVGNRPMRASHDETVRFAGDFSTRQETLFACGNMISHQRTLPDSSSVSSAGEEGQTVRGILSNGGGGKGERHCTKV